MINKLKSENGSSTILIALLLVTLVVFALLSLTTSASELRLAQKMHITIKPIICSIQKENGFYMR